MFQKLYRHLEEINHNLRQDKDNAAADRFGDKIMEQLESVNSAILTQNKLLESQQKEAIEARIVKKPGLSRYLQVVNLFISSIGIVVIIALSYYTYELAKLTKRLGAPSARPSAVMTSFASQPVRPALSVGDSAEKDRQVREHLARLDSLVIGQTQSLYELKKLNTVAVATFRHINKHFSFTDSVAQKRVVMTDSSAVVR